MKTEKHLPFYGSEIICRDQKEKIEEILKKFKGLRPDEELKKKIWDELQNAKYLGIITVPFKVVLRKGAEGKYPDCIEVIVDTKV